MNTRLVDVASTVTFQKQRFPAGLRRIRISIS